MNGPFNYRFITTRRPATLAKWWHELNRFGWPKELGIPDESKRDTGMKQIAAELGMRWIYKRLPKEPTP